MTHILVQWALGLLGLAIVGLVTDHIRIRTRIAMLVTQERLAVLEARLDSQFSEIARDLRKIAGDLEYLRGKSGG